MTATTAIHCPAQDGCTGIAIPPTPGTDEIGHYCETCGRAWDVQSVEVGVARPVRYTTKKVRADEVQVGDLLQIKQVGRAGAAERTVTEVVVKKGSSGQRRIHFIVEDFTLGGAAAHSKHTIRRPA